jgi:hypothetical protein
MPKVISHGSVSGGCFRSQRAPAWRDKSQPGHHREVWRLLDWGCRKGFSSELESGAMRIELSVEKRVRMIDAIDRLSRRYPECIRRAGEAPAWLLPCPRCGKDGYGVVVV